MKHGQIMQKKQGFTLLELIISMVIGALLLTIGVPSFKSLIEGNRILSAGSSIQHSLMFARSQSLSLINYITVCPLKTDNTCGDDWINGLDVFIDNARDKKFNDSDVKLKAAIPFNDSDTLVFSRTAVTFTPDGQISDDAAIFRYCSGDRRTGVNIAFSGQAKILSEDSFEDCL